MKHSYILLDIDLKMFDPTYDGGSGASGVLLNTNTTTQASLSDENKTFWDRALITLATPELIHDQFAQQRDIPDGNGKTIEFRQFDPLPELTTPLVEGVTPEGQSLGVSAMTATVAQYGGYVTTSDVLDMTALDPVVNEATKLIARQAGETLDTITRDVINGGTNVIYAAGTGSRPSSRAALAYTSGASNNNLTVDDIKMAVRALKRQNAPKIRGDYVAIIHPDVAYDLMRDSEWMTPKQYVDTTDIYNGEIGKLYGVRFIENTRAKVFHAPDLTATDGTDTGKRTLTVASVSTKTITIDEKLTTAQAAALAGRKLIIAGASYTVASAAAGAAGAATITINETPGAGVADNAVIYPGEAGAAGVDVYSTLVIADDAYGTTKVAGGGLKHIVKPLGSGGTSDPLDQRSTVGWKAIKTAKILVQQYLVRLESTATP
ncbi:MAG: N4-gp56 family major capsid protein [Oscillospiraceae bacterium]|nr:N4-gp56 family major capsid protein [Oscillospiraceae bacterium]